MIISQIIGTINETRVIENVQKVPYLTYSHETQTVPNIRDMHPAFESKPFQWPWGRGPRDFEKIVWISVSATGYLQEIRLR
jgi:hypothetical protein